MHIFDYLVERVLVSSGFIIFSSFEGACAVMLYLAGLSSSLREMLIGASGSTTP